MLPQDRLHESIMSPTAILLYLTSDTFTQMDALFYV